MDRALPLTTVVSLVGSARRSGVPVSYVRLLRVGRHCRVAKLEYLNSKSDQQTSVLLMKKALEGSYALV
jgi:hypothetical protein